MSKLLKAGLLILTLVIPALIFLFLKVFGTNHYDLPRYHPVLTGTAQAAAAKGDTVFYRPDVRGLVGTDSADVWPGHFTVLGQFDKDCADSCSLVKAQLERIYNLRSAVDNLQLVTFHKDGAQKPEGSKAGWYHVSFNDDAAWRETTGRFRFETTVPEFEEVSPLYKLILVDSNGTIRGYYAGADASEADRLIAEIRILDYERKHKK